MDIAGFSTERTGCNGGFGEHDPLPSSSFDRFVICGIGPGVAMPETLLTD